MEEVHMETVVERIGGVGPFSHHEPSRKFLLQQMADLAPEEFCLVLIGIEELFVAPHLTGLDQGTGHVGTEPVGTHVHPEAQDIFQVLAHRQHIGVVGGQLPRLVGVRIGESEIEGGLAPVEIAHELSVALTIAFDERTRELAGRVHPVGLSPDVIVGVFVFLLFL